MNTNHPSITFHHANAKGTGSAIRMQLYPAHDSVDGSIMLYAAPQISLGDRRTNPPTFPCFDWENAISIRLCFDDLTRILQVFRGETESIADGKGLFHVSGLIHRVLMRHVIAPVCGYEFEIIERAQNADERRIKLMLSPAEALGICEAIAGSMTRICFG